jgi:peptidyl-prolyl cis-trans isomerase C
MLKPMLKTCAVSCLLLASFQGSASPADPVATVNGKTLTQQDYDDYVALRAEQMHDSKPADPKVIIEGMVNRELVTQDAQKQGIDKNDDFAKKMEAFRTSMMAETAVRQYIDKHPIDDAALKKRYDEMVAQIPMPKEYKVRHILVDSEDEAKAIFADVNAGKDFAEIAKEKSKDAESKEKGGDLDWVSTDAVAFGGELGAMEKGKRSVTKTKFGWHVVSLDDVRDTPPPPFESVKANVKTVMQSELLQKYIGELRKSAKVEVLKKDEPKKEDKAPEVK